jgi:L-rhamnose mutarotase
MDQQMGGYPQRKLLKTQEVAKLQRLLFLSQLKPRAGVDFQAGMKSETESFTQWLKDRGIVEFSLYAHELLLFFYIEVAESMDEFAWPEPLRKFFEEWPGQPQVRTAVRMPDIFHDGQPRDDEPWRAGRTVERRVGALARLKPERYSSYIFYHYQMQEEIPEAFNKTYMIGAYDNYIFSYQELPAVVSEDKPRGLLSTRQTPSDWQAVMLPHFDPWPDTAEDGRLWRNMKLLFCFTAPE